MVSLIDYMIVNLTVVASDWLNYNTGWWRGRNPDGKHKKWGYILWDLDATFDYYINYSGVPNTDPDAVACDLEDIAEYMDVFFGGFGGGANVDVGKHEKIFLKLLEENSTFKQLYYSRYADMMNTVYSCENMINTLDKMLAVIEPEMPRQIQRWGGTMTEWQENVNSLKDFINQRCTLLDDGMLECYEELSGTYEITLMTEPAEMGEIDFNTLDIETFPWVGNYFGGMENKIKAKVFKDFEDDYKFSHWISTAGNTIADVTSRKSTITINQPDTLIAVFNMIGVTSTNELDAEFGLNLFPNPATDQLTFQYDLKEAMDVRLSLYSVIGQKVADFPQLNGRSAAGQHTLTLPLSDPAITSGLYFLTVDIGDRQRSFKVNIVK